jgi:hypothetical protein
MVRWRNPKIFTLPRIKAARLAAAKARRKPPDKKRTAWEFGELYWNRCVTLAINGVAILAVGFVLYILYQSVTQKVISIAPISVPKEMADEGYTPDVAAERLKDALSGHPCSFPKGRASRRSASRSAEHCRAEHLVVDRGPRCPDTPVSWD